MPSDLGAPVIKPPLLKSRKAQVFLILLVTMVSIIFTMLAMTAFDIPLGDGSLALPFGVITAAALGYFGSQMVPDAAASWQTNQKTHVSIDIDDDPTP